MPKERPILFSGPMVRAILEGRKTMTRRVVKTKHPLGDFDSRHAKNIRVEEAAIVCDWLGGTYFVPVRCPYGQPGDQLWVRETWAPILGAAVGHRAAAWYQADGVALRFGERWYPSIHMHRSASRLLLEVTAVRVERLQAITDDDARAEGARHFPALPSTHPYGQDNRWSFYDAASTEECLGTPRFAFGNAWDHINGKRAPWDSNPWVWVVSFRRDEPAARAAEEVAHAR